MDTSLALPSARLRGSDEEQGEAFQLRASGGAGGLADMTGQRGRYWNRCSCGLGSHRRNVGQCGKDGYFAAASSVMN